MKVCVSHIQSASVLSTVLDAKWPSGCREMQHPEEFQYMACKHRISFATNLAANFGCDQFRIMPDIVSKLLRAAI